VADFSFTNSGCVSTRLFLQAITITAEELPFMVLEFDDGRSLIRLTHSYLHRFGFLSCKIFLITDIGCISDTMMHMVMVNDLPIAKFTTLSPACAGKTMTFSDQSTVSGGATISKWTWNFGDGSPAVTAFSNANQTHSYASTGNFTATLKVETSAVARVRSSLCPQRSR